MSILFKVMPIRLDLLCKENLGKPTVFWVWSFSPCLLDPQPLQGLEGTLKSIHLLCMCATYVITIEVWWKHTWWNVIIDWCWGWQLNKGNIIFQGVWVPQWVSPSVVGGDFDPAFVTVSTFAKYIQYLVGSQLWASSFIRNIPIQKYFPPVGLTWAPDIVGAQH